MRTPIPKISLEQWLAFKTVVDEGNFAKAAERLNKSQSSISYAIGRLNEQLPGRALEIVGRKAQLTPLGTALYRYAEQLVKQAVATEQAARYLAGGCETTLTLVVDALVPMQQVFCALQQVSEFSPMTRVKLLETSLSGTEEAVLQLGCDVALMTHVPPGFLADPLATVRMIAVAAASHPLSRLDSISEAELKIHRQIVLRDSGTRREQNAGWLGAEQRWTVSHFASSIDAVRSGLGFAFVPHHRVEHLLASGELKHLPLDIGNERFVPLSLVITGPDHVGPVATKLAQAIKAQFRREAPPR